MYIPHGPEEDEMHVSGIGGNLTFHSMNRFDQIVVNVLVLTSVPLNHGSSVAQGYVVESGNVSATLLTDTGSLSGKTVEWLSKNKPHLIMIDACFKPGADVSGHNNVDMAIERIQQLDVERAILMHIAPHNWPYYDLVSYVYEQDRDRTIVSYDGMILHLFDERDPQTNPDCIVR
ncbi:MAG: MBL fold metallo-hydrolase [Chloroflexota bacterium]